MSYKVLNPLNVDSWDSLISRHPEATIFHTQSWAKLLRDTYGYEPRYFSIFTEDKLRFLLPIMEVKSLFTGRRGVSLPFTDNMRPIISCHEEFQAVWQSVIEYAEKAKWQYLELRGDVDLTTKACVYESFYEHEVRLEGDSEQIFSNFHSNHRKNIRKAIREGVEIEFRHDMQSVDEFYALNSITRKRHGIPSQPYKFFENLYKLIIKDGNGFVSLATIQGEVVAASVFLLFEKKAIFKYGASKKIKSLRANNLLMWETINWLSNMNYKSLNLGRTESSNDGLLRYKNGWASEQKTLNYYRYNIKDHAFVAKKSKSRSLSQEFFKVAPVTVSNYLGGVLYKHVG